MTTTDQPAAGTRWRGYSHKDLYLMLHDGPGAAASAEPSRRWAELATTLTEIGQDLGKALNQTGENWSGRAAGAAYDRLSGTATWAADAGESAAAMRTSVEDQGDHIAKARADMPKPEDVPAVAPDPAAAPAAQVIQAQTDAEPAEATAASAEERAAEVMAAYEENTNITTAAMATFDAPRELLGRHDIHHNRGGGLLGIIPTVASGLLGIGRHHDDRHRDRHRGDHRPWHSPSTSESSARWESAGGRQSAPAPAPGRMTGISTDPLLAPGLNSGRGQERSTRGGGGSSAGGGSGNGGGGAGGGGNNPAAGPRSGVGLPPAELQQAQAAAASQAAASAHPGAGAPIAPAGAPMGGTQDKMAMRRFGMDAIGSSQWFGDTDEPVVGQSPKRRFDLRSAAESDEQQSILDAEHHVPPTVIGEGGR